MNLDQQQQTATTTNSPRALVLAGAGSGKTRVLIERIAWLIETQKVSPTEILAFSFTRKASGEIRYRLKERIGGKAHGVQMGTMHGLALEFIHRFGEVIGLRPANVTVYGDWESGYLLADVAQEMSAKKPTIKAAKESLERYYQTGEGPKEEDPGHDLFKVFLARCRENNALTYGSLLVGLRLLVPTLAKYLHVRHILVDEIQDIDTCHPPGTLIRKVTFRGRRGKMMTEDVPIETLTKDDLVVSWKRRWGTLLKKGSPISIGIRDYKGDLLRISCGEKSVLVTPDHKFYAMMNGSGEERHAVYLMWRHDHGYRIGRCALRYCRDTKHKPLNGVGIRFMEERADKGWILRIESEKWESAAWEQVLSCKYGIPTAVFQPSFHTTKETIDAVFSRVTGDGVKCLHDHGLSFSHPLFERELLEKGRKAPSKRYFETCAMNLIPELMSIPSSEKPFSQEKITKIEKIPYKGPVYSLNVTPFHTYIANGMVVKNCQWKIINEMTSAFGANLFAVGDVSQSIYEFRGAIPKYLIDHSEEFDIYNLESNYRSLPDIVEASNRLIEHNSMRLPLTMRSTRIDPNPVVDNVIVMRDIDSKKIVLEAGLFSAPLAILSRKHSLLGKIDRLMEEAGITHTYIGKTTALTNSEPFRRFHAFLKLAVNPFDDFSFLLIRDIIGLSREEYGRVRLEAVDKGRSHFQVFLGNADFPKFQGFFNNTLSGFAEYVNSAYPDLSPESMVFIQNYVADHSDDITCYLDWLATFDVQDEIKGEETDGITLATVHAAKGLEWPIVFVAGCNEGIIPGRPNDPEEIEGERRLMYVAMTRAMDHLILTIRPTESTDAAGRVHTSPESRFIIELHGDK